eukprot:g2593.t1
MHGESVAWCEFIAFTAGIADIVVILLVIILYFRAKYGAEWLCAYIPDWVRRQVKIELNRQNRAGIDDGAAVVSVNPLEGIEMKQIANTEEPSISTRKMRRFKRYETEEGEIFFVEEGTEESVWDLPEDGEEVEQGDLDYE